MIPETLLAHLRAIGAKQFEVGDYALDLQTGKGSRAISVDGKEVLTLPADGPEIDWATVERAMTERL